MSTQIPGIYVEIKGDASQLKREMTAAREMVKAQATGMSNAINNALSPTQISNNINKMVASLGVLNRASSGMGKSVSNISADLGNLSKNTGLASAELGKLQQKLLSTQAAKAQERALFSIGRSAGLTKSEIKDLGKQFGLSSVQIKNINTDLDGFSKKAGFASRALAIMRAGLVALAAGYIVGSAFRGLSNIADEYTNINSKLKLVTTGTEHFNQVYGELFRISQETGSSFTTNATNFANLALALQDTNIASSELLQVFTDVNKSLVVAGASTNEVNSFMLQFKQALGANRLQGDEFRGMMEANSYWAGKFAEALGTDISGLYEMKEAGLLTTRTVLDAHKKMSESIASDFGGLQKTIGRATTELSNAWKDVFADANTATGSTNSAAAAISDLAKTITDNKPQILNVFTEAIDLTTTLLKSIINITNSLRGWAAVGDGRLSIFKFASMNAEEFAAWLEKDKTGVFELEKQIDSLKASMKDIRYSWSDGGASSSTQKEEIRNQIKALEELKGVLGVTSPLEGYFSGIGEQAKKAAPAIVKVGKKTGDAEKALKAYAKAGAELDADLWLDHAQGMERARLEGIQLLGAMRDIDAAVSDENFFSVADTIEAEVKDATTASTKLWEDFTSQTGNILEDFIGTTLKGQFDSIGDMFQGLLDSMLDMLANFLARAAANSIIESIFGKGASGGEALTLASLFGSSGGLISGGGIGGGFGGIGGALGMAVEKVTGIFASSAAPGYVAGTGAGSFATYGAAPVVAQSATVDSAAVGSSVSWAGPAIGAAIAAGVVAGIVGHFSDTRSVSDMLNQSGFGANISQAIGESLTPISETMLSGTEAFSLYRDAAYDANSGTLVLTSGFNATQESIRLTAAHLNETTGAWESLHGELSNAQSQLYEIAQVQGYVTAAQVENIAAMHGVIGATDSLKEMFGVLSDSASSTAASVGAAASYMSSAMGSVKTQISLFGQHGSDNRNGGMIGYASGGLLAGGSGYRDDVYLGTINGTRYMAMGGEFIVNREDTQKNLGLLQAINSGANVKTASAGPMEIHIHHQTILEGKVIKSSVDRHIVERSKRGVTGVVNYAFG